MSLSMGSITSVEAPSDSETDETAPLLGPNPEGVASSPDVCRQRRCCGSQRWTCYKNLGLHCVSTFFIFSSFMTFQSVDSALYNSHDLGQLSFTVLYGGFILSCLLAPVIVRELGSKNTMVMCFMLQFVFACSHLYPRFYTLLPASLLLGLAMGPFWTAQGLFIVALAKKYSRITTTDYDICLGRFFGIFNFFYMSAQKFGNLLESQILKRRRQTVLSESPGALLENGTSRAQCGAAFCGVNTSSASPDIPPPQVFYVDVLVATFIGLCMLGIIVKAGFVDSPRGDDVVQRRDDFVYTSNARKLLSDVAPTFVVHKDQYMYLLLPLFFYSGFQQGFIYGDYTKSFVACELGIGQIGYVMLAYGYADALSSVGVGCLEKLTGRLALFVAATLVQAALVVAMQLSTFEGSTSWLIYVVAGLWGIGDAIWQTTTNSMIGTMFFASRDAAFSCFRLWQAVGLATSFAYGHALCQWLKLYVLLAVLVLAMAFFLVRTFLSSLKRNGEEGRYQTLQHVDE